MTTKPIIDFEDEYFITDGGDVIDVKTNKKKLLYTRGNEIKPRIDLYKNGELVITMYLIDLILHHFFKKTTPQQYSVFYKDGNVFNCSISNLEITSQVNLYVPKKSIKKPNKIFEITENGVVVKNMKEIEMISKINKESRLPKKRNYIKILPPKGSEKYLEGRERVRENGFIKNKLKRCLIVANKEGLVNNITVEDIIKKLNSQNRICPISGGIISTQPKNNNTLKISRLNKSIGFTPDNIILISKKF